jgi:hypothetical protein
MKVKPLDFVVIGAHKAATTALFHYLRRHPQLFLPPEKEAGFFSNDYWWERGWVAFADEFFGQAPVKALWGKVTPQYMACPQVPARIRAVMPEVKLVAILRNPVDRAYSHYRMAVRTQAEKRSFDDAVVALQQNPDDSTGYLALGQYGRILSTYLKQFPATQLLTLFTEDLERQPQLVLDALVRYLGADAGFTPSNLGKRYHVGGTRQRFSWLVPKTKQVHPVWWLWKQLPERHRRVIRFWFQTEAATASAPLDAMESEQRRQLVEYYRSDVQQLEALLGRAVPWEEFHSALD